VLWLRELNPDKPQVGLVATLHDPAGCMLPFLPRCLPLLTTLYHSLSVIVTPETAPELLAELAQAGVELLPEGTPEIGVNRRQALALGLAHKENVAFHYCDFDRLLYWVLHEPAELCRLITEAMPPAGYLALGRTPEAFASHPLVQLQLESLTNQVFSHIFGAEMDVTAGSCAFTRPVAEFLLAHSTEPTNATDTEWPMLVRFVAGAEMPVHYQAVAGLAFETATFHGADVFRRADNPQNWRRRTILARDSIAAALRLDPGGRQAPAAIGGPMSAG